MTDKDALGACPFCGGRAVMRRDSDPGYPCYVTFDHESECVMYAVPTDLFRSFSNEAEAIAAWNRRTPAQPFDAAGVREALAWYGEQARLARLIHSEGDAGRHALAADGGKLARQALEASR